jgi:hypothetical protein
MMFGMGFLLMLLVIGLPLLLVVVLASGLIGILQNQNRHADLGQTPKSVVATPVPQPGETIAIPARYCAHCGASLQSGWTHCPQCGAPAGQ